MQPTEQLAYRRVHPDPDDRRKRHSARSDELRAGPRARRYQQRRALDCHDSAERRHGPATVLSHARTPDGTMAEGPRHGAINSRHGVTVYASGEWDQTHTTLFGAPPRGVRTWRQEHRGSYWEQ